MNFENLAFAYLFIAAAGLIVLRIYSAKARRKTIGRMVDSGLTGQLTINFNKMRRTIRSVLFISAIILCIIALMRPRWGFEWVEVNISGLDIIIALDTSKSMLAEDMRPSRFGLAKLAIGDFVRRLHGDRIGLVAFAGSAFLQCPLTVDYSGFALTLDSLNVGTIPVGGTSIKAAIDEAGKAFAPGGKKNKVLIIISDGEDLAGDAVKAAKAASDDGIRIFTIGIGTPDGELIPIRDENGSPAFLKDNNGNLVKSRLDENTLRDIAFGTGGSYVRAEKLRFGLDTIYLSKLSDMERQVSKERMQRRYFERFMYPLLLAIIILLIEPLIPETGREI